MKKGLSYLVAVFVMIAAVMVGGTTKASAETKTTDKKTETMTTLEFVKLVVDTVKAPLLSESESSQYVTDLKLTKKEAQYVATAVKAGIIDDSHFDYLKGDCIYWEAYAILVNADKYLRGDRLGEDIYDSTFVWTYDGIWHECADPLMSLEKQHVCMSLTGHLDYSIEESAYYNQAMNANLLGYIDETRLGVDNELMDENGRRFYSPTQNIRTDAYTTLLIIDRFNPAPADRLKVLAKRLVKCNKGMYELKGTDTLTKKEQYQFTFTKTEHKYYDCVQNQYSAAEVVKVSPVWKSSNKKIATVDQNGLVTAVGKGTVTISATYHGRTYKQKIKVTTKAPAINRTSATVTEGQHVYLDIARAGVVTWTSSNEKVATVDENGSVSALKNGSATIKATTKGGKTYSCSIKVTKAAGKISDLYPHLKKATYVGEGLWWSTNPKILAQAVENSTFKAGGYDITTLIYKGVRATAEQVNLVVRNRELEDVDGYEWIFFVAHNENYERDSSKDTSEYLGYSRVYGVTDKQEVNIGFEAYDAYTLKCFDIDDGKTFSVDWNGDTYDNCFMQSIELNEASQYYVGMRVPVGYDGLMIAMGDAYKMVPNNFSLESSSVYFTVLDPRYEEHTFDDYIICDDSLKKY